MKFLVAFNNFKGSLSNEAACRIAAETLRGLGHEATPLPLGDGGRGTFSFLRDQAGIQVRSHSITGAFGDPRTARSWWKKSQSGMCQIFLESTDAIGYPPSDPEKRDALGATSRGLGEWLLQFERDLRGEAAELFIGLGDSAISDAGKGMLDVLSGRTFPHWKITVLCDVENPLCGPKGSARVFSPQKGATPSEVTLIENKHLHFAKKIQSRFGFRVEDMPRTGSAGGLAAALYAFVGGKLVSGSQWVLQESNFEQVLREHDVLMVGEGKSDSQTLSGKSPWAAIQVAEKLGKKSVLISGALGEGADQIQAKGLVAKVGCGREPDPKRALERALELTVRSLS